MSSACALSSPGCSCRAPGPCGQLRVSLAVGRMAQLSNCCFPFLPLLPPASAVRAPVPLFWLLALCCCLWALAKAGPGCGMGRAGPGQAQLWGWRQSSCERHWPGPASVSWGLKHGRGRGTWAPLVWGATLSHLPTLGNRVGIPPPWISWSFLQSESSEQWDRKGFAVWGQRQVTRTPLDLRGEPRAVFWRKRGVRVCQ